MNKLNVGDMVTISVNVYSREYNGKYYNQIDGWWFTNQSNEAEINTDDFAEVGNEPF